MLQLCARPKCIPVTITKFLDVNSCGTDRHQKINKIWCTKRLWSDLWLAATLEQIHSKSYKWSLDLMQTGTEKERQFSVWAMSTDRSFHCLVTVLLVFFVAMSSQRSRYFTCWLSFRCDCVSVCGLISEIAISALWKLIEMPHHKQNMCC